MVMEDSINVKKVKLTDLTQEVPVLNQLIKIKDLVSGADITKFSQTQLKQIGFTAATLLLNLGQIVAHATLDSNALYIHRKWKEAKEFNLLRKSVNRIKDAESLAKESVKDDLIAEIEASHRVDVLKSFHEDMKLLVMYIQSCLRESVFEERSTNQMQKHPEEPV